MTGVQTCALPILASPFGRRERFYDGRAYDDPVALTSEAYAELDDSRTKKRMVLEPSDVEGCRFGVHYGFGDVVSAEYLNMLSNYEIAALTISTNGATWRRQISLEEYV